MTIRFSLSAAAAIIGVTHAAHAQATNGKRAFTPADWYRLTTVSAPALSPDGRLVAFTVTTVNEAENKRHSEVWAVPAAGGEPVRYTSPGTESSAPRFSPDGRFLLFNSKRAGSKATTWALRLDRPAGEAFPADSLPRAGSMPRDRRFVVWADSVTPDSGAAAPADSAAAKRDPWAKMQAMARPPHGAITKPLDAGRFDGRHVVDWRYKSNDRGFLPGLRAARTWRPLQLWTQPADGSAPKRQLTSTAYSHFAAAVSPDGRWIAFTADTGLRSDSAVAAERDSLNALPYDKARDEREPNDVDVFVMPVDCGAGCTPRRVTRAIGNETNLAWSPDGKRIAYVAAPARTKSDRIYAVSADGSGAPENLLGDWRYEPDRFEWLPSGEIVFPAAVGGRTALFSLAPKTRAPRELIGGRRRLSGFATDAAHARVAYVATSMTAPTELYLADASGRNERRLTHFNDKLSSEIAWSDAERFTYKSIGDEIEGWLMKPYGYTPGKRYPLVLYIHGGPHSAYGENWFDEFQNLAGAGMFVLFTNPRGSSGYGADFTYSTRGRWGAEDYEDLMKAVDIAAARPDVDSTRMGVTGGSYGGFMTAWITTKTNRFKAAQVDRMISDWTYWYGASDAQGLTEFEFFGKPWDNFALYDTLSPIRHVTRVKTPTLLVQSEEDFRTPIGNAELWFTALRKQGVPAELVRYPRSTHELSRSGEPWLLVDRLGRLRQWFSYWLIERPQTTASASSAAAGTTAKP